MFKCLIYFVFLNPLGLQEVNLLKVGPEATSQHSTGSYGPARAFGTSG